MYQELGLRGLTWDAALAAEIKEKSRRWKLELKELNEIRVSRSVLNTLALNVIDLQLHGFSDASLKAYGAVIYLRIQDSLRTVVVHF